MLAVLKNQSIVSLNCIKNTIANTNETEIKFELNIWNSFDGSLIRTMHSNNDLVYFYVAKIDSVVVIKRNNFTIQVLNATTGHPNFSINLSSFSDSKFVVKLNQEEIATGGPNGTITIWNANTGKKLKIIKTGLIEDIKSLVKLENDHLASWSYDGLKICNVKSGVVIRTLKGEPLFALPGNRLVTQEDDKRIFIWNVTIGQKIFTLKGHVESVTDVLELPGNRLASAAIHWFRFFRADKDIDKVVFIWDLQNGTLAHRLENAGVVRSMVLMKDNITLAVASDGIIKFWNIQTGQLVNTLQNESEPNLLAVLDDGRLVSSSLKDGLISIWK